MRNVRNVPPVSTNQNEYHCFEKKNASGLQLLNDNLIPVVDKTNNDIYWIVIYPVDMRCTDLSVEYCRNFLLKLSDGLISYTMAVYGLCLEHVYEICRVDIFQISPGFLWHSLLRTFAPIATAHRYCASKFTCHVIYRAPAVRNKISNAREDGHCYSFARI